MYHMLSPGGPAEAKARRSLSRCGEELFECWMGVSFSRMLTGVHCYCRAAELVWVTVRVTNARVMGRRIIEWRMRSHRVRRTGS